MIEAKIFLNITSMLSKGISMSTYYEIITRIKKIWATKDILDNIVKINGNIVNKIDDNGYQCYTMSPYGSTVFIERYYEIEK